MIARRKKVEALIIMSSNVEEADRIINEYYDFKDIREKIAFLKGMFDAEVISVHNGDGISKEESDRMTYFAMLEAILHS